MTIPALHELCWTSAHILRRRASLNIVTLTTSHLEDVRTSNWLVLMALKVRKHFKAHLSDNMHCNVVSITRKQCKVDIMRQIRNFPAIKLDLLGLRKRQSILIAESVCILAIEEARITSYYYPVSNTLCHSVEWYYHVANTALNSVHAEWASIIFVMTVGCMNKQQLTSPVEACVQIGSNST